MNLRREASRGYRAARRTVAAPVVRRMPGGERFTCPICGHRGRFMRRTALTGARSAAVCPVCRATERDRVQTVLLRRLLPIVRPDVIVEMAPTPATAATLAGAGRSYVTTDLFRSDVDVRSDVRALPFGTGTVDLVVISHVLEHVREDDRAIAEVARIVSPTGVAFVAVPVVGAVTVEYPAPNPLEDYHVRAPGLDYYGRLTGPFAWVCPLSSDDVDPAHQPYYREDRTVFPSAVAPHRTAMSGRSHPERLVVAGHGEPSEVLGDDLARRVVVR